MTPTSMGGISRVITGFLTVFERGSTCTPVGLSKPLFPGGEVVTVVLAVTVRFFESPWTI